MLYEFWFAQFSLALLAIVLHCLQLMNPLGGLKEVLNVKTDPCGFSQN
jgi:hypothetical protein